MNKLKQKNKPELKNDFERMIPFFHKGSIIYGEHLVRYAAIKNLVKGKIILDIASGSGYGTALLATEAKSVYGVDINKDAINYAKENYGRSNIAYLSGDGVKIPIPDNSVDVVVSFETIEHIEDYRAFMAEIKRVLRDDGVLVLSTPNDLEFAEGNHFHIHEFERDELTALVKEYFSDIKEYFQADWIYSGVHSVEELTKEWEGTLSVMNVKPLEINQSLYFFMLCSSRKITEELVSLGSLAEHWSERKNQNKQALTEQHIGNISNTSEDRLRYIHKLEDDIKIYRRELKSEQRKLADITQSRIYRLMQKLRLIP